MTLLTLDTGQSNNPRVQQGTSSVTTMSLTFIDDSDTNATYTFSLAETRTVLAFYTNCGFNTVDDWRGYKSAISVDGTDRCIMHCNSGVDFAAIRNSSFWVGQLAAGSHTIKGRISAEGGGGGITVSERTLIVVVLNGDEAWFSEDSTVATTASETYTNDINASLTQTPSSICNALFLYATAAALGATEHYEGKKTCIRVGSTDYTASEVAQSTYPATEVDSQCTVHALSDITGSTTMQGRFATTTGTNTVTVSNRAVAMLFFNHEIPIDVRNSATSVTTTSDSLVDDSQLSLSRSIYGHLLAMVAESRKYNSTGTATGTRYGLMIDDVDVASSRSSASGIIYPESNFVVYAQAIPTSKQWTIKGRLSTNSGTNRATVDSRNLVAIWFPDPSAPKSKEFTSSSDIKISKEFTSSNDIITIFSEKTFSSTYDVLDAIENLDYPLTANIIKNTYTANIIKNTYTARVIDP